VVGAAAKVLARAAADLVHAVVAGQAPAVTVVGGQPAAGDQQARPGDDAGLDRVADLDVHEVLLAHDPHRGGPRGEVLTQVLRRGERLRHRPAAELTELIAEAGTIEACVWQSIRPGITKRWLRSSVRAPAGAAVASARPTAVMRPSCTMIPASWSGAAPVPSNSVPHRIAHTLTPSPRSS
jgi:hypothetical protein